MAYQETGTGSSWGHVLGCRSGRTWELFRFYLKYNRKTLKDFQLGKKISDLYCSKMVLVFHGEWARGGVQKKQKEELGSFHQKLGRDDGGIRIIGMAWRVGGANP